MFAQVEMPSFYSCSMEPLEMQEMSSDNRFEDKRPNEKNEGEPANENSKLTYEQPGDKRFVKSVSTNVYLLTCGCDQVTFDNASM